jgi:hypothetical protein
MKLNERNNSDHSKVPYVKVHERSKSFEKEGYNFL